MPNTGPLADKSSNITEGGISVGKNAQITIGSGDVVGRDKITTIVTDDKTYDVAGLPNPYLGLRSFTYAERARYAGRKHSVEEAVVKLTTPGDQRVMLFITGASGSGKSSLAQAGLLPALEFHYAPRTQPVQHAVFRPGAHPMAALDDALGQLRVRDVGSPSRPIHVLLIDQFEELFTQSQPEQRDTFFRWLTELPPFTATQQHIIATLRSDYLKELFDVKPLWEVAKQGIELRAMGAEELKDAILRPLQSQYPNGEKRMEPALVERLAQETASEATYLPLLQVTLEELWKKGRLVLSNYGTLADAIKQRADQVFEFADNDSAYPNQRRTEAERAAILDLFLSLVNVSPDDDPRRDVRVSRATTEFTPEQRRLTNDLSRARLLSVEGEADVETVNVIHETLISNWDRLREGVKARRQQLRQRGRFEQQLQLWLANKRSNDYLLLTKVQLAEARELDEAGDIALRNIEAQTLLRRSIEYAEAERQRELEAAKKRAAQLRQRALYLAGALALAVVAFVAAGVFSVQSTKSANAARTAEAQAVAQKKTAVAAQSLAEHQRIEAERQAQIAFAGKLAAQGQAVYEDNPLLGLRLAVEGYAFAPLDDADTRQSTANTIRKLIVSGRALKLGDDIKSIYPDAVNSFVVLDRADNPAELRRTADGAVVKLAGNVNLVTFSPDPQATYFMVRYRNGNPRELRRTADGAVVKALIGNVVIAYFSPDPQATYLVAYYDDIPAELRRTTDGTAVKLAADFADIEFSPDPQATYFVVRYGDSNPAELRRTADGAVVTTLTGDFSNVTFSPDPQATYFVVRYRDGNSAELRRTADGAVVKTLTGDVFDLTFSPDPQATYFVVRYGDANPAELHRTADDIAVKLAGDFADIKFSPDPQATYFVVRYRDGHPTELRLTADGAVVTTLTGDVVDVIFSPDPQATYFVVRYGDSNPAELRRTADGAVVTTLTGDFSNVTFSPDPQATYFVVRYRDATSSELRRTADGTVVTTLTGDALDVTFSPDPQATYVVVGYLDGNYGATSSELRRTTDGAVVKLPHDIEGVTFSPDPQAAYFVVNYIGGNPSELRRSAGGTVVKLNGDFADIKFSPDPQATYFVVSYDDSRRELWTTLGEPHRLVQFGLGLEVDSLTGAVFTLFDMNSQRLIIHYLDGRAYVLDLALLGAVGGDAAAVSPEELTRLACQQLLAPEKFDESQLAPYLGGQEPRACR